MHRTIVIGSPREYGRSAHLAEEIFNACIDECPEDGVSIVSVASINVGGCKGCDACKMTGEAQLPEEGDPLFPQTVIIESEALKHNCIIDDDMVEVRKHLDAADELIVVSPVYFAGAPAQMKALLDRLQPYYWSDLRKRKPKRALTLHVVGEGGDPHGIEPLIGVVRSSCAVAGFELSCILDWRGCIEANGEIVADAREYRSNYEPVNALGAFSGNRSVDSQDDLGVRMGLNSQTRSSVKGDTKRNDRPKLDLKGKPTNEKRSKGKSSGKKKERR